MKYTPKDIGELVKSTRKAMNMTQENLGFTAATSSDFIVRLEQGKDIYQLGKILNVLHTLGIEIHFTTPAITQKD